MYFFERNRHDLVIDAVLPFKRGRFKKHRIQIYRTNDGSGQMEVDFEPVPDDAQIGIASMGIDPQEMEYMLEGIAESTIERKHEPISAEAMAKHIMDTNEQARRRASGLVVFGT